MAAKVDEVEGNDHVANNGNVSVSHTEATWGDREPYGPPGFRGMFANYYVLLCASFAAVSVSLMEIGVSGGFLEYIRCNMLLGSWFCLGRCMLTPQSLKIGGMVFG